jgi:hypothetical protein
MSFVKIWLGVFLFEFLLFWLFYKVLSFKNNLLTISIIVFLGTVFHGLIANDYSTGFGFGLLMRIITMTICVIQFIFIRYILLFKHK